MQSKGANAENLYPKPQRPVLAFATLLEQLKLVRPRV